MSVLGKLRMRPMFYAAIVWALGIAFFDAAAGREARLPDNDISRICSSSVSGVLAEGRLITPSVVRETRYGYQKYVFDIAVTRLWTSRSEFRDVSGKLRVYGRKARSLPEYADRVLIAGDCEALRGPRNPGGFDQRRYLTAKGIGAIFRAADNGPAKILKSTEVLPLFKKGLLDVRARMIEAMDRQLDKRVSAFVQALILGERRSLEEESKELFLRTGTIHILAVSGFNVAFLAGLALWLTRPMTFLWKQTKLFAVLTILWLYCALVGWEAPVLRATIMASIILAAQMFGRRPDGLNSLGIAACVIFAINPDQLYDLGFQLSFLCVWAMIFFVPGMIGRPDLWPNETQTLSEKFRWSLRELFWISFVCIAVTLPLTIRHFYIVSPSAYLANLAVVPLTCVIFTAGLLFCAVAWIPGALGVGWLLKISLESLYAGLSFIEALPGSSLIVGTINPVLAAALWSGTFVILWRLKKGVRPRWVLTYFLMVAAVLLVQEGIRRLNRDHELTILDVGQGDAIYYRWPGGNLLMDTGSGGDSDQGRWVVAPFLKSQGVRKLDFLVVSHPQEDHMGGFEKVFDDFAVKTILLGSTGYDSRIYRDFLKRAAQEGSVRIRAVPGYVLSTAGQTRIEVLNSEPSNEPSGNVNDDSIVLKITGGGHSALLTGDIQEAGMNRLLTAGRSLASDILKVPHHGGKMGPSGERFLSAVEPKIAVISVGRRNRYRHPDMRTLDLLRNDKNRRLLRTDKDGAVTLIWNNSNNEINISKY